MLPENRAKVTTCQKEEHNAPLQYQYQHILSNDKLYSPNAVAVVLLLLTANLMADSLLSLPHHLHRHSIFSYLFHAITLIQKYSQQYAPCTVLGPEC